MKQIIYVSSSESQQIYVWQLKDTGTLKLLQTINVPGQGQSLTINPNKNYLYVGVRPLFNVVSYRIKDDGTLRQFSTAPLPGSPSYIATDLLGCYLFSASYSSNCISVSRISNTGMVTAPIQQIRDLLTPHSVNINPVNQCLLVPCLMEDCIRLFNIGLDGQLVVHKQRAIHTATGAGPRHIAFYPNGKYAYCINELNGTVDVLTTSNNNKYHIIQTLDIMPLGFTGKCWAADIHITPDGRFLYTSERTMSILTILKLSIDGSALSVVSHQSTEVRPRSFNIDHGGRFIISAGQQTSYIMVHKINQDSGKLSSLARYPVARGPVWVSILPQSLIK